MNNESKWRPQGADALELRDSRAYGFCGSSIEVSRACDRFWEKRGMRQFDRSDWLFPKRKNGVSEAENGKKMQKKTEFSLKK